MAKKVVATLKTGKGNNFTKAIKMVKFRKLVHTVSKKKLYITTTLKIFLLNSLKIF